MGTGRIEAFSDGVIAVIITIMVLELKVPRDTTLTSLYSILPQFNLEPHFGIFLLCKQAVPV